MRVELRSIIDEIEYAQKMAKRDGRQVSIVYLTNHAEVVEFKKEFSALCPNSEDDGNLFESETFWKGTRIKLERGEPNV